MPGPLAGASDAWHNAPEPAASVGHDPTAVWSRYVEARRWPAVNSAPFMTRGHEPQSQVDVRANELASAAYVGLVTDTVFADGAALVEFPHSVVSPGNGLAMVKAGGRWSFIELDARGSLLAGGALPLCIGCHLQASSDQVFGLPRAP